MPQLFARSANAFARFTLFGSIFLIGGIGMVLLAYGKKQVSPRCLLTGGVLCVFPYFVSSLLIMWLVAGACLGGLYLSSRTG